MAALPVFDRADTHPPRAGAEDAHSAPTKVGPMSPALVQAMMMERQQVPSSGIHKRTRDIPVLHEEPEAGDLEPTTVVKNAGAPLASPPSQAIAVDRAKQSTVVRSNERTHAVRPAPPRKEEQTPAASQVTEARVAHILIAPAATPKSIAPSFHLQAPTPERMSNRALALRIGAGTATFLAISGPILWWLFA